MEEQKSFFQTIWDYTKKGAGWAKDFVVESLRAIPGAFVGLGLDVADLITQGKPTGEVAYPQTFGKVGEIVLGTEPIKPLSLRIKETAITGRKVERYLTGRETPLGAITGGLAGFGLWALDATPIGFGKQPISKKVLKEIAKSTDKEFIYQFLKKELPQMSDDVLKRMSEGMVHAKTPKEVLNVAQKVIKRVGNEMKIKGIPVKPPKEPPKGPPKPPIEDLPFKDFDDAFKKFFGNAQSGKVVSSVWKTALKKGQITEDFVQDLIKEGRVFYEPRTRQKFFENLNKKLEQAGVNSVEDLYKFVMKGRFKNPIERKFYTLNPDERVITGWYLLKNFLALKPEERPVEEIIKLSKFIEEFAQTLGRGVEIFKAVPQTEKVSIKPLLFKTAIQNYAEKRGITLSEKALTEVENIAKDFAEKIGTMTSKEFEHYMAQRIANFAKEHLPPLSSRDRLDIWRIGGMLFNPYTMMRNFFFNTFQTLITRPAVLVTRLFTDKLFLDWLKLSGSETLDRVYWSNLRKNFKTMLGSLDLAFRQAAEAWRSDLPSDKLLETFRKEGIEGLIEAGRYAGTRDFISQASKLPLRFSEATDRFYSTLIYAGEKARLIDLYKKQGVKIDKRLMEQIDEQARSLAEQYLVREGLGVSPEKYGPLANALDFLGKEILSWREKLKEKGHWFYYPFSAALPFIRTPINIGKEMLSFTPEILLARNKTGEHYARFTLGSIIMGLAGWLTLRGQTTFLPPKDPEENKAFYNAGKKPFSIEIAGIYIPVYYFGALGLAPMIPAAVQWAAEDGKITFDESLMGELSKATMGLLRFLAEQTSLTGMTNFVKLLAGEESYTLPQSIVFTAEQYIPFSGLLRTINRFLDPVYRKAGKTVPEALKREIAGYYKLFLKAQGLSDEEIEKLMPEPYLRVKPTGEVEPATRRWYEQYLPWAGGVKEPEMEKRYQELIERKRERKEAKTLIPEELSLEEEKRRLEIEETAKYLTDTSIPREERVKRAEEFLKQNPELEEKLGDAIDKWKIQRSLPKGLDIGMKQWSVEERAWYFYNWVKENRKRKMSEEEMANFLDKAQEAGILTENVEKEIDEIIRSEKEKLLQPVIY